MESKSLNVLITMTMLAVILLVWTRTTNAALERVEDAYELRLEQVERWPLADSTSIVVRPCDQCNRVVLHVSRETCYLAGTPHKQTERCKRDANRGKKAREDLLRRKSTVRNPGDAFVYIFYRPEDQSVACIVLDTGNTNPDDTGSDDEDTDSE